jgi:hypothetical protein
MLRMWPALLALWLLQPPVVQPAAPASAPDFTAFRERVQPILLAKRPPHARCVSCHTQETPMRLQPLAPGSPTWDEEQSRRNFAAVMREVVPGDPLRSRLLIHPLAGGDNFHLGGEQWASQDDPEWQILADWVRHLGGAPGR